MKILPIILSNRQTGFKNTPKQTANNTTNQNAVTNSMYNNSNASLATRNLAFGWLYDLSASEQLAIVEKLEKDLSKKPFKDVAESLCDEVPNLKTPESQLAVIELFKKYPELPKQETSLHYPIHQALEFRTPEAQQELFELIKNNPELAQLKNHYGETTVYIAACGLLDMQNVIKLFKAYPKLATSKTHDSHTPLHAFATHCYGDSRAQLSLIKLFEKHPEWTKITSYDNMTPLNLAVKNFESPRVEQEFIKLFRFNPEVLEANGAITLRHAAKNFKTAEAQQALVEIFGQNLELAKESNKKERSALYEAVSNFKTPEGQRAIITLLYEHPEIVY